MDGAFTAPNHQQGKWKKANKQEKEKTKQREAKTKTVTQ
jgi:hypothetical protein